LARAEGARAEGALNSSLGAMSLKEENNEAICFFEFMLEGEKRR